MVTAFLKAIPCGIFLTIIVCLFIGSAGSSGGVLHIRNFDIVYEDWAVDFNLYWSWVMFVAGTVLAWAILFMMSD